MFAGTINQRGTLDVRGHRRAGRRARSTASPRSIQAGAVGAGAGPALRRPLRRRLHAARVRRSPSSSRSSAGRRWAGHLPRLALPGAGPARARLPVRARDLDAGDGRRRARRGRPPRHPDQGRGAPRAGPPHSRTIAARQDRHAHARSPDVDRGPRRRRVAHRRRRAVSLAASLDAPSEHPVAHAIVAAWDGALLAVDDFEAIPGRGVAGTVDGVRYHLGNHRLDRGPAALQRRDWRRRSSASRRTAKTAVVLMTDDRRARRPRRRRHDPTASPRSDRRPACARRAQP